MVVHSFHREKHSPLFLPNYLFHYLHPMSLLRAATQYNKAFVLFVLFMRNILPLHRSLYPATTNPRPTTLRRRLVSIHIRQLSRGSSTSPSHTRPLTAYPGRTGLSSLIGSLARETGTDYRGRTTRGSSHRTSRDSTLHSIEGPSVESSPSQADISTRDPPDSPCIYNVHSTSCHPVHGSSSRSRCCSQYQSTADLSASTLGSPSSPPPAPHWDNKSNPPRPSLP